MLYATIPEDKSENGFVEERNEKPTGCNATQNLMNAFRDASPPAPTGLSTLEDSKVTDAQVQK